MSGWRPIESHDKSSADFLASVPESETDDARVTLCAWGADVKGNCYIDLMTGDPCQPSHWMPKPGVADG